MQLEKVKTVNDTTVYCNKFGKNKNIYFYVNENKGTVVCKKINCEQDVTDLMYNAGLRAVDESFKLKDFYLKEEYIGKAKCHFEDKFDLNTGIEIAQQKMFQKYYNDKTVALGNALIALDFAKEELYHHWFKSLEKLGQKE